MIESLKIIIESLEEFPNDQRNTNYQVKELAYILKYTIEQLDNLEGILCKQFENNQKKKM